MLLCGCKIHIRGSYLNLRDDTLALKTVGFLQSRNVHLSRDCITEIDSSENSIDVIVPFDTDLSQEFVVYFTTTADPNISVLNSETNEEWVSNETTLSFASNTTSYLVKLTSQYASTGSPATREYTLYIKKFFVPELTQKTWAAANASGNIDLVFEFRDENNSPIASGIDWTGGSASSLSYDNKVTIESYSPGNSSGKFQGLLVKQEIPGVSTVFIPNSHFETTDGRFQATGDDTHPEYPGITGTFLTFTFAPSSAVYLSSTSGDDNAQNAGLSASTPAGTLGKIIEILKNPPSSQQFQYIYAAAGDYDTDGEGLFTDTGPWISIIGGWNSDFTTQDTSPGVSTFRNSQQPSSPGRPSAVFEYNASNQPPYNIALADITIEVNPDSGNVLANSTALLVSSSAGSTHRVTLNNVHCAANQGSGDDTYGVFITDTNVEVDNSRITGGTGSNISCALYFEGETDLTIDNSVILGGTSATGDSMGIRIAQGPVSGTGKVIINDSKITSGQSASTRTAYGIHSLAVTELEISNSSILAGFKSWGSKGLNITNSYGLKFEDAIVSLDNVWIHSFADGDQAVSILSESVVDSVVLTVDRSTFISENAQNTNGMVFQSNSTNSAAILVQNSVIYAAGGENGNGFSIDTDEELDAIILNNTIHIDGNTELSGIDIQSELGAASSNLSILNNIFYSSGTSIPLKGIKAVSDLSSSNTSGIPGVYKIHHNNFWASAGVEFDFSAAVPNQYTLKEMQENGNNIFHGNVSRQVDADMSYDYSTSDFDMGRITSPAIDVQLGGIDIQYHVLSQQVSYADKDGSNRSGAYRLGWSMGAIEYDNSSIPTEIHVDVDGSDYHPLGTEDAPFASISRAVQVARNQGSVSGTDYHRIRDNITKIMVNPGEYETTETLTIENSSSRSLTLEGISDAASSPPRPKISREINSVPIKNLILELKSTSGDIEFNNFDIEFSSTMAISDTDNTVRGVLITGTSNTEIYNTAIQFVSEFYGITGIELDNSAKTTIGESSIASLSNTGTGGFMGLNIVNSQAEISSTTISSFNTPGSTNAWWLTIDQQSSISYPNGSPPLTGNPMIIP